MSTRRASRNSKLYREENGAVFPDIQMGALKISANHVEGETITTGSILVQQTVNQSVYALLIDTESIYEGLQQGEVVGEKMLCVSEKGPIFAADAVRYDLTARRVSIDEWSITARPIAPLGDRNSSPSKPGSTHKSDFTPTGAQDRHDD